jgi:hypothetical protein
VGVRALKQKVGCTVNTVLIVRIENRNSEMERCNSGAGSEWNG